MKTLKLFTFTIAFLLTVSLASQEGSPSGNVKKTTEDYIADLNSGDPYLQQEACLYLGKEKEVSAIESLIFLLQDQNVDAYVRASAASALGSIGKQEGTSDVLLQAAQKGKDAKVRYAALLALASLKDEDKLDEMKEVVLELSNSSDEYLRDLAQKIRAKYEIKEQK